MTAAESTIEQEDRVVFPGPEFEEAAGAFQMIKQNPEQLQQYRARTKFRMDEMARSDYAREEGEKIGRMKGELIGQITTLQSILSVSKPDRDELLTLDLPRLNELANQFQQQLRNRSEQ